jgi:hypothetical protein
MHDNAFKKLIHGLDQLDFYNIREQFVAANEFVQIPDFLSPDLTASLIRELDVLDGTVHRSYIPGHKKGGSIGRYDLEKTAPIFDELYHQTGLLDFFRDLSAAPLVRCPRSDPHAYALYYYTEAGDHIGYHYDRSYYKGARYTVLLGLIDESSCKLECQLYKDDDSRDTELLAVKIKPGMLVFFNGDKLYHRITPLGENERRVVLTLEFLTQTKMNPLLRFVSNVKDSVAYFGFKQVFQPKTR